MRERGTPLIWDGGLWGMIGGHASVLPYGGGIQEPLQEADAGTLAERNHDDLGVRDDSSWGKDITHGIDGS